MYVSYPVHWLCLPNINIKGLPTHCGNELIQSASDTFNPSNSDEPCVTVECGDFLSCYGSITVQQSYSGKLLNQISLVSTKLKHGRWGQSVINCGQSQDEQSCRGGEYTFNNFRVAKITGNVRESVVKFTDGGIAMLDIKGGIDEQIEFYMNEVIVSKGVYEFKVNAGDYAVAGSYIDLTDMEWDYDANVMFNCEGINSCTGLIIAVRYCGPPVTIDCTGYGSCGMMTVLVVKGNSHHNCGDWTGLDEFKKQQVNYHSLGDFKPSGKFEKKKIQWKLEPVSRGLMGPLVRFTGIRVPNPNSGKVRISVVCGDDICSDESGDETSDFLVRAYEHEFNVGTVTRYNDVEEWQKDITTYLKDLKNQYADKNIQNIQKWIFEPKQHAHFAAVMYEATMSHLNQPYGKVLATTLLAVKLLVSGLHTPLPLIIPGLVLTGFGVFYMIKKARDRAYDNAHGNSAAFEEFLDVARL